MALKTDYKNDVLDTSANTKRKYTMVENSDGTVSFTDKTTYTSQGDVYGAGDVNSTNKEVNTNAENISAIKSSLNNLFVYNSSTGKLTIDLDVL